ncbi:MAG: SUMF1/EgtB/PvdO family nonheme iron enzyme [Deltaproteobacteria bacterium]|nr:SUMF1/EgtB/PvdO family nonheme iron enzyme [Deltaproteobacteria bacterium]MBT6492804.1 SUMF1/EgtB/PvdO family nonheme iron enzyme [Deltaproteobacteria bacterium]
MKPIVLNFTIFCCLTALAACGGESTESDDNDGSEVTQANASTMMNQLPLEDCTEFGCANGCVQIDYGVDENADGDLDISEIDGTEYICHGLSGQDGANGTNGVDGEDGVDGSDCTVSEVDCLATLTCEDGTSVSWNLMGCMAEVPEGMVEVPASSFLYGNPTGSLYLPTFYIDKYPVTAGDYKACVDGGMCQYNGSTTSPYRTYDNGKDTHPINFLNWYDATAYCIFNGKRLPTEQEWEKAARGTDGRTYPWGEDAPDGTRSNYWESGDDYDDGTTPVGYFNGVNTLADGTSTADSPSPYGAYDMAGNVWEWTNSWSSSLEYRMLRGGSFGYDSNRLPTYYRDGRHPDNRNYGFAGFRCAQ